MKNEFVDLPGNSRGYPVTAVANQPAIRQEFWERHPEFKEHRKPDNKIIRRCHYPDHIWQAWDAFLADLVREGELRQELQCTVRLHERMKHETL